MPVGVSSGDADFGTVNKTGGNKTVTLSEAQIPKHSHSISIARNDTEAASYGLGIAAGFAGRVIVSSSSHKTSTESVGSGSAHSILPPYQTMYMWKRTV